MQRLHVIAIAICLCGGCHNLEMRDPVQEFIPGVYVRGLHHEYAIGSDTLVISLVHDNNYSITKRSRFQRISQGKLQKSEHSTVRWMAIYNEKEEVLHEQRQGKVLSFDPKHNRLFLGAAVYDRVKE